MKYPNPITHTQRCATFGEFTFIADSSDTNPERIRITGDWVRQHLVEVEIPQLAVLGRPTKQTCHYKVAKSLVALWADWERFGVLPETFNGLWVPRFKRQSGTVAERIARCQTLRVANLSNHSWGTAFDIDAAQYPLGRPAPTRRADPDLYERVRLAEHWGWAWGGAWRRRPDAMHFEATEDATRV